MDGVRKARTIEKIPLIGRLEVAVGLRIPVLVLARMRERILGNLQQHHICIDATGLALHV